MSESISTSLNFSGSKIVERKLANISLFSHKNSTSKYYVLPSYLTYLVIKHYEIPTGTYYDPGTIELDNVDFLVAEEEILESKELINVQNQHDAYFLEPINIKSKRKVKVVFK